MPDPTSRIHFSSMEGMDLTVQNWLRSNLDGLVRVWPNASVWKQAGVQESFGLVSGRTQPACYQFLTWFCSSTDIPDNIVQNQPWSNLVLADCVRFWPDGSVPEASQCARIIRPASGQRFPANPDGIRSGMFTGLKQTNAHRWDSRKLNPWTGYCRHTMTPMCISCEEQQCAAHSMQKRDGCWHTLTGFISTLRDWLHGK